MTLKTTLYNLTMWALLVAHEYYSVAGAGNVLGAVVLVFFLIALLQLCVFTEPPTKAPRPFSAFRTTITMLLVVGLVWHGWFWSGAAYLATFLIFSAKAQHDRKILKA